MILFLVFLTGCEVDTRVIVSKENPPKFTFTGTGKLAQFYVAGPYTIDELKLVSEKSIVTQEELAKIKSLGDRRLWQLDPGDVFVVVSKLPEITYGKVPSSFTQKYPKDSSPLPLKEGMYYGVSAPSSNANFIVTKFVIQNSKAKTITP